MRLLRVLCTAAFFACALAKLDLAEIITKTPRCAQECSLKVLSDAKCPLDEMASCLCTNRDLQKTLATCVLKTCNVTDQYAATSVRQEIICKGMPTDSRTKDIVTTFIILAVVTYPIVVLRIISRWVIAHKIWWDDWCILLATMCLIPLTVLPFLHTNESFGRHFWDVLPERIVPLRKTYYAVQMIYCTVMTLSKMSILFLYLRIFLDTAFRRVIKVSMVVLLLHGLVYLFCIAFQCLPVSAIWTMEPARCLDLQAMIFSGAGLSIFEDFFIMLLPIWELNKLNLSTRRKVALVFMFALGSFASITSIIRLRYIAKFGNSVDVTWDNVDVVIWSDIEMFTAVICASIICIRPLISKFFTDVLGISRVAETLPTSHKSSKHSTRWSEALGNKLSAARNSGHTKLKEQGTEKTISTVDNNEAGGSVAGSDSTVQVWVTNSASVERGSVQIGDMYSPLDNLTSSFRTRTIVEVSPPLSPAAIEARTGRTRGRSLTHNTER